MKVKALNFELFKDGLEDLLFVRFVDHEGQREDEQEIDFGSWLFGMIRTRNMQKTPEHSHSIASCILLQWRPVQIPYKTTRLQSIDLSIPSLHVVPYLGASPNHASSNDSSQAFFRPFMLDTPLSDSLRTCSSPSVSSTLTSCPLPTLSSC